MIEEFLKILESKSVSYTKEGDNLTVGGYLYLEGTNIKKKKKIQKPKENFRQSLKQLKLGLNIILRSFLNVRNKKYKF